MFQKKTNTTHQFVVVIHVDFFLCCKSLMNEEKKNSVL